MTCGDVDGRDDDPNENKTVKTENPTLIRVIKGLFNVFARVMLVLASVRRDRTERPKSRSSNSGSTCYHKFIMIELYDSRRSCKQQGIRNASTHAYL